MDSDGPKTVALTVSAEAWLDVLDEPDEPPDAFSSWAERVVRATLDRATDVDWLKAGEISLLLSDDRELQKLNAAYRQKDRATNVLSFPGLDLVDGKAEGACPPGMVALGDVVISHERLTAEADALDKPRVDHFAHLLVHGVLHLLGYDHEDDDRALTMETLEAEILQALGFAAPYAPVDDADDARAALSAAS
jgi:probable rRNA maturation factor